MENGPAHKPWLLDRPLVVPAGKRFQADARPVSESIRSGTSAMGYYESKDSSIPPRGVISFRSESERVSVMWISND